RDESGRIDVLVWNSAPNAAKLHGDPTLDRRVELRVEGLPSTSYDGRLARVDREHSNIARHVGDDLDWPSPEQWKALRLEDRLDEDEPGRLETSGGAIELELELPMPGVARLRLDPGGDTGQHRQGVNQ